MKYVISLILFLLLFESDGTSLYRKYYKRNSRRVKILFCGDVMMDWGVKKTIDEKGAYSVLSELRPVLKKYDFRICNLENPISEEGTARFGKKYIFRASPEDIYLLKHGLINGVNLANNHAMDFGKEALLDTIDILTRNGINYTGAGVNLRKARRPLKITIGNIRFAILGYSAIGDKYSFAAMHKAGTARAWLRYIKRDIKRYRKRYDFIVISLHWGNEYSSYPTKYQVNMAHAIINSGADCIVGHHSHIYQGVEIYRGKPIFYSLGNYIFGSINEDIKDNIIVGITFKKKAIESFKIIPVNCNDFKKESVQYRILNEERAAELFSDLKKISLHLGTVFPEKSFQEKSYLQYNFYRK